MKNQFVFTLHILSPIVMMTMVVSGIENDAQPMNMQVHVPFRVETNGSIHRHDHGTKERSGPKVHHSSIHPDEIRSIGLKRDTDSRELSWVSSLFSFAGACGPGLGHKHCSDSGNSNDDDSGESSSGQSGESSSGQSTGDNKSNGGYDDVNVWQYKASDDTVGGTGREGNKGDEGVMALLMIAFMASVAIGALYMSNNKGGDERTHPLNGIVLKRQRMFQFLAERLSTSRPESAQGVQEVDESDTVYSLA